MRLKCGPYNIINTSFKDSLQCNVTFLVNSFLIQDLEEETEE